MKRHSRATVICEPFELDRAQELALVHTVADAIAEDLIRERDEAESEQQESEASA